MSIVGVVRYDGEFRCAEHVDFSSWQRGVEEGTGHGPCAYCMDKAAGLYEQSTKARARADMATQELGEVLLSGNIDQAALAKRLKIAATTLYTHTYRAKQKRAK